MTCGSSVAGAPTMCKLANLFFCAIAMPGGGSAPPDERRPEAIAFCCWLIDMRAFAAFGSREPQEYVE